MPRPAVNVAVNAARAAGKIILRYMNRLDNIQVVEKHHLDFASEVDRLAEETIVHELRRAYPRHAILAEESGASGDGPLTWIVDPLDGTHNYLRGIPHFCVSIALVERQEPIYGVVYDPLRDELFIASKGDGAYLNDRRLRVGKRETIDGALLATSYPYTQRTHLSAHLGTIGRLLERAQDVRRTGSAALDLAYTAAGRLDACFQLGLKPWDIAAGCLLVREAGGTFTDLAGRGGLPASGNLLAGNHHLVAAIAEVAAATLPPDLLKA